MKKALLVTLTSGIGAFTVLFLLLMMLVLKSGGVDSKVRSDTILVLGARSYIAQKYNPCLVARLQHAADLYQSGYAQRIIVSGGKDKENGVSEAEVMKKILESYHVPASAIQEEKAATSTYENFLYAQKLLKERGARSSIIVTESFHMARASLVADHLNLTHTNSPVSDSPCSKRFTYFLKEPLAILVYLLQGKL